jgi:hypothetical protein
MTGSYSKQYANATALAALALRFSGSGDYLSRKAQALRRRRSRVQASSKRQTF